MDDTITGHGTFSAVWQRVVGASSAAAAEPFDEQGLLSALIDSEEENFAFYTEEAKYTVGSVSELFSQLADVSALRLGRLRTFHFILFGTECTGQRRTAVRQSPLQALRSAYWRESKAASMLISAAAEIGSGKFNGCAAEFARLSAENTEKIMHHLERLMR